MKWISNEIEPVADIRKILMDSSKTAVTCTAVLEEETFYNDSNIQSFIIPHGDVVTINYTELATALYNAGYRKLENQA